MATAEVFVPIEEKHGEDCTCPAAGRIVIDLVAASRLCPGDRNPHRAARTAVDGTDGHIHHFEFHGPPGQRYPEPCPCGEVWQGIVSAGLQDYGLLLQRER